MIGRLEGVHIFSTKKVPVFKVFLAPFYIDFSWFSQKIQCKKGPKTPKKQGFFWLFFYLDLPGVRGWAKPLFFANRHEPGCKKTPLFELKSRVDTLGRSAEGPLDGGALNLARWHIYMAAFKLSYPPIDPLPNYPKFSIREIILKTRVF